MTAALLAAALLQSPAGPGSGEPNLASDSDRVYMSWLVKPDSGPVSLLWSAWDGERWSPAAAIASGRSFMVNWADFPSLVPLAGGGLAAHWLEAGSEPGAYGVAVAVSTDSGRTWSEAATPHKDASPAEHGFVSMAGLGGGRVGVLWLDGRRGGASGREAQSLRYAVWEAGGFGPEAEVDRLVCSCCQTAMATVPGGLLAVYRDRSQAEIRDIAYARLSDGHWSKPRRLHTDGWKIPGCPVNGPALSADREHAVAAWFSAPGDQGRVSAAFSRDGGQNFGKPVRVDEGDPVGRVSTALLADGNAVVSWLEAKGEETAILARRVSPDGTTRAPVMVARATKARAGGFPRLSRLGDTLLFAWTDTSQKPRQVRVARLELSDLP